MGAARADGGVVERFTHFARSGRPPLLSAATNSDDNDAALDMHADPPATSQNHSFTYDEPIKVESVTQAVCDLALRFGEGADEEEASMVSKCADGRAVSLLTYRSTVSAIRCCSPDCRCRRKRSSAVSAVAPTEPSSEAHASPTHSYHADPSGTFMRYDAKAIGSGSEGAQNELQDSYNKVRLRRSRCAD